MAAATAATVISTKLRHGKRSDQAKRSSTGQVAKPTPKLKEATNPPAITANVADQNRAECACMNGRQIKETSAPAIMREALELKPPDAVICARPIQKFPTITTRVAVIFAVKSTVLSRHAGMSSSPVAMTS